MKVFGSIVKFLVVARELTAEMLAERFRCAVVNTGELMAAIFIDVHSCEQMADVYGSVIFERQSCITGPDLLGVILKEGQV